MHRFATLFARSKAPSDYFGGNGPRGYVGGLWHEMGELQFKFLVSQGLRPEHVCLDIACGSLRAGVRIIPYLDPGNYLGLDISPEMIEHGVKVELGETLNDLKKPELVVSSGFEFDRFSQKPDYAVAQSLFTHLTSDDIRLCLRQLRDFRKPTTILYATFHQTGQPVTNPDRSGPHSRFAYSASQMDDMARDCGWRMTYIGDWDHPRQQKMLKLDPVV